MIAVMMFLGVCAFVCSLMERRKSHLAHGSVVVVDLQRRGTTTSFLAHAPRRHHMDKKSLQTVGDAWGRKFPDIVINEEGTKIRRY
jgi:hypothetical protein